MFQVHHGFYSAYHNTTVRPGIISAVKSAKELYGDLQIMVTGHSMGGAMAAFCGLDLRVPISDPSLFLATYILTLWLWNYLPDTNIWYVKVNTIINVVTFYYYVVASKAFLIGT